jgi:hypothetical protein
VETVITVSVITVMVIIGVLLIHLLNGQHNERIAAFHYSDALPGIGRRRRKSRQPTSPPEHPSSAPHPEHRDGAANDAWPSPDLGPAGAKRGPTPTAASS